MIKARVAYPRDDDIRHAEKRTLPLLSHYDPIPNEGEILRSSHSQALPTTTLLSEQPKQTIRPSRANQNQSTKPKPGLICPPPHPPYLRETETENRLGLGRPVGGNPKLIKRKNSSTQPYTLLSHRRP